jgi:class 3 adenylate cyclase
LRIGLHTGPVIAGLVGQRRFIYDVWGDAVNVAARMEAAGGAGQINLSEAAMNRVKNLFEFEDRGAIEVKNKGPLRMYYLRRIQTGMAQDPAGRTPNAAFHEKCSTLFPGYAAAQ